MTDGPAQCALAARTRSGVGDVPAGGAPAVAALPQRAALTYG
jgi:hypothetical protein